jgi:hypothetical protein
LANAEQQTEGQRDETESGQRPKGDKAKN